MREDLLARIAAAVPGCAIAVVRGSDDVDTLELGYGDLARHTEVTRDSVFHYFSGTKLYTATAVMRLRDRGRVDLDAPVAAYLPELELTRPVTVRQLLTHTSGLRETLSAFLAFHFPEEPMPSAAQALSRYRTTGGSPPGGRATYHNVNYAVLGALLERVEAASFVDVVHREVLRPLGSSAAFEYRDAMRERAAVGYLHRLSPMRALVRLLFPGKARRLERERVGKWVAFSEFVIDSAAIGGLLGEALDFLPLVREMLDPEDGLLSAETKREMLTLQAEGSVGVASRDGVGIGWKRGDGFWNHEGGGPGFTSETRVYPSERLGIVILMNATQNRRMSLLAHAVCEKIRASLAR